ncbi:MAG: MBL fold metallo-hydrolase [Bacteroidetes bacterium]|nr:MAG: MBL fold metallo-hydrolase [Bacteroidota bacterium]
MTKVTFLGTGTSQGIPVIACNCAVCTSNDIRDNRTRTSIMITSGQTNLVIDTGPDFRQQMLRENVKNLDGVVFTHEHKDHIAGMDDIRAFNFIQKRDMDIYATAEVQKALHREFHYVFAAKKYPGVPLVKLHSIDNDPFKVGDIELIPINVLHYMMPVKGYRIGDFSYITDAKTIPEEEFEKLKGSKILVINALRKTSHISHFNLEEALQIIDRIKPDKAYLIHLSHLMGTHRELEKELPENVEIAVDGLTIEI